MKQRIELSRTSWILSFSIIIVSAGIIARWVMRGEMFLAATLAVAVTIMMVAALFYMPMKVALANGVLSVHRSLWIKDIPLSDIESVRLCQPTMGAIRICGSGGFLGYWGWFRERDLGKYFAYYGRASDCFLVTLADGRKYMLGCKNADSMVKAINKELTANVPAKHL